MQDLLFRGRSGDSDALAWRDAVVAAGGAVSSLQLTYVTALVQCLKAGGVWDGLDRLWLFAAENAFQALIDLRALATATAVNSPAFTARRGYKGDGVASYINSGFNASSASGAKFTQDAASMGVWIETAPTLPGFEVVNNYSAYSLLSVNYGGNYFWAINSATSAESTGASAGADAGFFHLQRTGASADSFWRNGTQIYTGTTASTALLNQNHGFLSNLGGMFSDARLAAGFIGGSLAGKEAAFASAMRSYMTGQGVA